MSDKQSQNNDSDKSTKDTTQKKPATPRPDETPDKNIVQGSTPDDDVQT